MKLLFVDERFGSFAGAGSDMLAAAAELNRRGHAVGMVYAASRSGAGALWDEPFLQEFPLGLEGGASQVLAALEQFQPDAVCVHTMTDVQALETLLASGVPTVRMLHGHDVCCVRNHNASGLTRRVREHLASPFCASPRDAFLARRCKSRLSFKSDSNPGKVRELELSREFSCLVVPTQFLKEELLCNRFDPEKIEILPPVPRAGNPAHDSSFCDRNIVLYAGQMIRGSGVDVLIESLGQVRVPFECFLFGDGNHRASCERLTHQLGLADRIHFKGCGTPEEIDIYYRECSVVAVSSAWSEPFGAVCLEGMRYGLPVVAFDTGGIREWLINGYNGYRVPWMDRAAFATRVEALLRDKALARRMGRHGKTMVAEYYGFSTYVDRLEELFARVAKLAGVSSA